MRQYLIWHLASPLYICLSCILLGLVTGQLPTYANGRVDSSPVSCFSRKFQKKQFLLPLVMYLKEKGMVGWVHQTVLQQHKAHLHSSSYKWCTIFLISVLYKIPVFCVVQNSFFSVMYNIPDFSDVQYSCFLWCTIFLISVMYNIPLFCDVQYSCFPCSIIVWCMIIWCILFLKMAWCT